MKTMLSIAVAMAALPLLADKQPLERYQSIIDRQMFGKPPADFDPTVLASAAAKTAKKDDAALSKEEEELQRSVKFSVINMESDGSVMVGFTDTSAGTRHYYLREGETKDGWFVKAADAREKTMTIVKDGIELVLTLGESSGGKAAPKAAAKAAAPATSGSSQFGRRATISGTAGVAEAPGAAEMPPLNRSRIVTKKEREARRAAEQAKRDEERRLRDEENKRQLEDMRRELRETKEGLEAERAERLAREEEERSRAENAGKHGPDAGGDEPREEADGGQDDA